MGLLDDAIREHIELKRRRGADPSEVARQEQDALGPVSRERDIAVDDSEGEGASAELVPEDHTLGEDAAAQAPPARGPDFADIGQETAELDMRTVLDEQHETADRAGQIDSAGLGAASGEDGEPVEDVLEETPDFLRDTPEQERLWFEQRPPRDFDFDK
jgi:hypothetical protein